MKKVYIAGDMLKKGSQMLRAYERDTLSKVEGIEVFTPQDEEDINDKTKNPTAEEIFAKDTKAILDSEVVVVDADDNSVGTTTEVGQIWGVNYVLKELHDIVDSGEDIEGKVIELLNNLPLKEVHWHNSDIRNVPGISEEGLRRSFSINQYLYGCLLDVSGKEESFENIVNKLQD